MKHTIIILVVGLLALQASADFAADVVAAQNAYRTPLGEPPLKWDANLAQGAQQWAEHIAGINSLTHSDAKGAYGENLAARSGSYGAGGGSSQPSSGGSAPSAPSAPQGTASSYPSGNTGNSYPTGNTGNSYPTGNTGNSYPTGNTGNSYPTGNTGNSYPTGNTGNSYPTGNSAYPNNNGNNGNNMNSGYPSLPTLPSLGNSNNNNNPNNGYNTGNNNNNGYPNSNNNGNNNNGYPSNNNNGFNSGYPSNNNNGFNNANPNNNFGNNNNNFGARNPVRTPNGNYYGNRLLAGADTDIVNALVGQWAAEKQYFKYGKIPDTSNGGVSGHYTQMCWAKSTSVGCGIANNGGEVYLCCRYYPPGNTWGEAPY